MEYGKVRASVELILPGAELIQFKGFANGNQNYNVAKETITKGFTKEDFPGLADKQADLRVMRVLDWCGYN